MSALGMATLGVQCEDKALGMSSLGLHCVGVVAVAGVVNTGGKAPDRRVVNVIGYFAPAPPSELHVRKLFDPVADAVTEQVVGDYAFLYTKHNEPSTADGLINIGGFEAVADTGLVVPQAAGEVTTNISYSAYIKVGEPGALIAEAEAGVWVDDEPILLSNPYLQAEGVLNLTDEELVMVVQKIRSRRRVRKTK